VKGKLRQQTEGTRHSTLNDENITLDPNDEAPEEGVKLVSKPPENIHKSIHELNINLATLKSQILTQSQVIRNNTMPSSVEIFGRKNCFNVKIGGYI